MHGFIYIDVESIIKSRMRYLFETDAREEGGINKREVEKWFLIFLHCR